MSDVEQGKDRIVELLLGLLRSMKVDPTLIVLKWDQPEEILDENQLKLPNKTHKLRVYRGEAFAAIKVLQSDLRRPNLDAEVRGRYERHLSKALTRLCGENACREPNDLR